jgi:hypothetical protein
VDRILRAQARVVRVGVRDDLGQERIELGHRDDLTPFSKSPAILDRAGIA